MILLSYDVGEYEGGLKVEKDCWVASESEPWLGGAGRMLTSCPSCCAPTPVRLYLFNILSQKNNSYHLGLYIFIRYIKYKYNLRKKNVVWCRVKYFYQIKITHDWACPYYDLSKHTFYKASRSSKYWNKRRLGVKTKTSDQKKYNKQLPFSPTGESGPFVRHHRYLLLVQQYEQLGQITQDATVTGANIRPH